MLSGITSRINRTNTNENTNTNTNTDEKSWRWPQSGNELNEPAGEQWRPLGADLATGFASTIARIKIHKQIQNNCVKNMFKNTQTNTNTFAKNTYQNTQTNTI